ncbi:MAG: polysaccharide biosynthesis/export family protein [Bryobacteraceae bacterium]
MLLVCLYLIAGLTAAWPAQGPPSAQQPPTPSADEELRKSVGEPVDPNTYVIGAEDVLRILVWREPELSGQYLVRPDGMITLPLLKRDIKAGGLTPKQLEIEITKAYEEFITKPSVTVSVATVNSKKYFIIGGVNRPGQYPLVVPTTVLQALAIAGGLREFADARNIVIIRGPKRYKFNYRDVIRGRNMVQNIYLESGDIITVPD